MFALTLLCLPFALTTVMTTAVGEESNLLTNGGFEEGMDGWMFVANSGRATATIDRKVKRQGRRALHIQKEGGMPFDLLRTDIQGVTPGTSVLVSAQVKGKAVVNAFLKFWVYDASGASLVEDVDVVQLRGTFDWKRVQKTYDLPAGAAKAAIMVLMVMGGDLWIDDVRVEGTAGPGPLDAETRTWLDEHASPLLSLEFEAPAEDLAPLAKAIGDSALVLLGEESHGDGTAFRVKTRLIKYLHEKHAFDVVAFEAGLFECEAANALLAEGKVKDAMFASVPGVWRVEEVRPLFEYMAATTKTGRPLRLTGFDLQATGGAALELGARLADMLGDEDFSPAREALFRQSVQQVWDGKKKATSKQRKALRAAIDATKAALATRRDALVAERGERDVALFEVALENFRLWEEAGAKRKRSGWAAVNERDSRMAENLLWLARTRYADARIVAWGATMHFMHGAKGIREGGKRPYQGCKPMGQAVHDAVGDETYVLGFVAHHGDKGTPFWGPFPIPQPPEDSIEDLLHRYGRRWLFVDLKDGQGPFHEKRQAGPLGYNRAMTAEWAKVLDGLVFTDVNAPSTNLSR